MPEGEMKVNVASEMAAFEAAYPYGDHTKYRNGEVIAGRARYAEPEIDKMFSAWLSARASRPAPIFQPADVERVLRAYRAADGLTAYVYGENRLRELRNMATALATIGTVQSREAGDAAPPQDDDDLDSPEARLVMIRTTVKAIIDGGPAIPLAKAALDFCDLTTAERQNMRGEAGDAA